MSVNCQPRTLLRANLQSDGTKPSRSEQPLTFTVRTWLHRSTTTSAIASTEGSSESVWASAAIDDSEFGQRLQTTGANVEARRRSADVEPDVGHEDDS